MTTKTEKLAANLVNSGQWLTFEVYVAWIQEQNEPQLAELAEECEPFSCNPEACTVRPQPQPQPLAA